MKLRRLAGGSDLTELWFIVADWIWLFPFFAALVYFGVPLRHRVVPPWALVLTLPLSLVWVRLEVASGVDELEVHLLYIWCVVPVWARRRPLTSVATSRSSDDLDHPDELGLRAGPADDVLWLEVYQADALAASLRAAMAARGTGKPWRAKPSARLDVDRHVVRTGVVLDVAIVDEQQQEPGLVDLEGGAGADRDWLVRSEPDE